MPEQLRLHRLSGEGKQNPYFQNVLRASHMYRAYRKNVLSGDKRAICNKHEYTCILKLANKKMMEAIILESKEVTFPYGMGSIRVVKKKLILSETTRLMINWKETHKLPKGQFVYHLNEHSNGFSMKFYWNKGKSMVANIGAYSFLATAGPKGNKRFLSRTILGDNPVDYLEVKRSAKRPRKN